MDSTVVPSQIGECLTCRDNPGARVCWHNIGMWATVRYVPALNAWIDLHGHSHKGHEIIPLSNTKFQVTILPELEITV